MAHLVVGATGLLGGEICRLLAQAGERVRAMTRPSSNPERVAALAAAGVEVITGDLKSRASLDAACRGVDAVFSTATALVSQQPDDSIRAVDLDGQSSLIDAAAAAGASHFVYVSVLGIQPNSTFTEAKLAVEAHLRGSGLTYTILQPSCFMDVWFTPHTGFDVAAGTATIYGDGTRTMRWVLSADVARVAVAALRDPSARNAVVPVGGPEPLSPLEAVKIFEDVTGRPLRVTHVPVEHLRQQLDTATDPAAQSFAALMLRYAAGDPAAGPAPVRPVGPLTSVRDFAQRYVLQ